MAYYCKKCGQEFSNLGTLSSYTCPNGGRHEPYTGHETGPYHCKKCGQEFSNLGTLSSYTCPNGGKHEPLE